ncbi:MAG: CPBP family intramembrane glutamic endopeptidase [Algibacter sp.]
MKSIQYKITEFFTLFILLPISFAFNYPFQIKMAIGVLGFSYIIFVLLKVERKKLKIESNLNYKTFVKHTTLKLLVIVVVTTVFVWFTNKELLFNVLLNKPKLWLLILFIYSFFSVYPQELIYRAFYFERYKPLFENEKVFLLINAVVFSLAHLLFKNALVLILTFLGGLFFAFTYYKTKSTVLVSIEHAIYGCWLFTVGMGGMLGFPA